MNQKYQEIIALSGNDRRDLFLTGSARLGTTIQNIEKDFWVCWTLDALFHRLKPGGPRFLFKGGTSLSKAYGLITRFSEDIDVTVFREDIGVAATVEELESLSRKPRHAKLDAIREACRDYISGPLRTELEAIGKAALEAGGKSPASFNVGPDPDNEDGQNLLIHYPSVVEADPYIAPSVKIESGAKSALDPNEKRAISPYIADDLPEPESLAIPDIVTIDPERTFLDKVLILHGMTHYFAAKGALRGHGRMSRHYYDIHKMMADPVGPKACADAALIADCVRHAKMFFYRGNTGLDVAARGSFQLRPSADMLKPLEQDYAAMSTMIFGQKPDFATVIASVGAAEDMLNAL
jgi:hypothetical protein